MNAKDLSPAEFALHLSNGGVAVDGREASFLLDGLPEAYKNYKHILFFFSPLVILIPFAISYEYNYVAGLLSFAALSALFYIGYYKLSIYLVICRAKECPEFREYLMNLDSVTIDNRNLR